MPDPGDRVPADGNNAPTEHDNRKTPQHFPELTEEVTQAGIPMLDQQVAANVLDDNMPTLDETFTMFEKNVPVLDETADPSALSPDTGGDE